MKKYMLTILLFILFMPSVVYADEIDLNFEIKVLLDGKDLSDDEFTFLLKDIDGNIVDEQRNLSNGTVKFNTIKYNTSGTEYLLYTIEQKQNDNNYIYDTEKTYIRVDIKGSTYYEIAYYKEDDYNNKIIEEKSIHNINSKAYIATDEELQGQAYAFYDSSNQTMKFFRDVEGKYVNGQIDGTKIYYTDFERLGTMWRWNEDLNANVKTIIFEDSIKPINMDSWFIDMVKLETINLKKLDTSLVTNMYQLFYGASSIKRLDLSTFDTSNVQNLGHMFKNCTSLEEVIINSWDLSNVKNLGSMFRNTPNLKYVDIQNMNNMYVQSPDMTSWISNSGIKYITLPKIDDYSITRLNKVSGGAMIQNAYNLEYLDLSGVDKMNYSIDRNWTFSASFNQITTLKKLKIGDCFNPYPDSVPSATGTRYSKGWLNIETQKFYDIDNYHYGECYLPRGTYIQFLDSTSNYKNTYINFEHKISIEDVIETKEWNFEVEDIEKVEYNTPVKFKIKPKDGFKIKSIRIIDGYGNNIEYRKISNDDEYEFIMPDSNVKITPIYEKINTINVPDTFKNPETGDRLPIFILILIISLGIGTFIYKQKESRFKI